MSKLLTWNALAVFALGFPALVLADVSGTPTLTANSTLSLDSGTTGTSGGDILWTGSDIQLQGSATGFDLGGTVPFSSLTQATLSTFGAGFSAAPIAPAANDVIAVKTNGGHYAKILVKSISGTSISLQFTTFGATSTSNGPVLNALINNYSGVLPGYPGYGIAPGSIFVIYGTGMSDNVPLVLQSSISPGLPTTLNHASISVTVNGKTVTPGIYYAVPTQVAAVLPSSTPVGSGTITLTYNGQASQPIPIQVTASAFGLATLNQAGTGGILATDYPNYNLITPTASVAPGQTIILWGSGLGADTNNNDRTYPNQQDNLNNATVYVGGIKANVGFAGRSAFPGVDQINVTIPPQTQAGCGVSVAVVAGGRVSNFGTLPVNPGNGVCQDSLYGINGTELTDSGSQTTVKTGSVGLLQGTAPSSNALSLQGPGPRAQTFSTTYFASASFSSVTGASYVGGSSFLSLGSCLVTLGASGGGGGGTSKGLDAGSSIGLSGGGITAQLSGLPLTVGSYFDELSSPFMGGSSYKFTGPGGKDVGQFSVTIPFPVPLNWTNESSISTVTEANGQLITWSGGATGTYVAINGDSSSSDGSLSASFFCLAPVSAGQFTIPSYVLETLPPGNGDLAVYNSTMPVSFTATGIDHGSGSASVFSSENVSYK